MDERLVVAGRQQKAAELAQQICANSPAHAAAADAQRFDFSDWASTDGDLANSWPKKTAERQANVPPAAQLSSATPRQPGHAGDHKEAPPRLHQCR